MGGAGANSHAEAAKTIISTIDSSPKQPSITKQEQELNIISSIKNVKHTLVSQLACGGIVPIHKINRLGS